MARGSPAGGSDVTALSRRRPAAVIPVLRSLIALGYPVFLWVKIGRRFDPTGLAVLAGLLPVIGAWVFAVQDHARSGIAATCWLMYRASSLTKPRSAEPRVCCQVRPRKYRPG